MKKVLGINASPRKNRNTAQAVEKALEGAASVGAETHLVHLYELNFKGCSSCFACKRHKNNAAICVIKDDLKPLLEEAMSSDVLFLGSPVYFGDVTSGMRAFLERLMFMNYTYNAKAPSKFQGRIASGIICTMNVPDMIMEQWRYPDMVGRSLSFLATVLNGPAEWLAITDTMQYDDYSKYMSDVFDADHKALMHKEKLPLDLEAAFKFGVRLASGASD